MGRGKPFVQPITKIMRRAGGGVRPNWISAVEMTPPQFEPVSCTRPPRIVFPEDKLRETFLRRNPSACRVPVNLMAASIPERHIADRFVALQMRFMNEEKLSEDDAYQAADRIICSEIIEASQRAAAKDMYGPLVDPTVKNEEARLYLASVRDSNRDKTLHQAFINEKKEK